MKVGENRLEETIKDTLGNIFVKLSSLGLEAEIQGDIVIIRYK